MDKHGRREAILELVQAHRVPSQEALRGLLLEQGVNVTQATLSRDMAELRLVKVMGPDGGSHYTVPQEWDQAAALDDLLPTLFVSVDVAGHLVVIRTVTGSAQAVGLALDRADWPESLGSIAGDDTVLLVVREPAEAEDVRRRIEGMMHKHAQGVAPGERGA